jgi:hypothetical protein
MNIFISTPCSGWEITGAYWTTIEAFKIAAREQGWSTHVRPIFGVSDLIKARNLAVHHMLSTDADVLLTFDSDQWADPKTLVTICKAPMPICAAPVPKKAENIPIVNAWNFLTEPDKQPEIVNEFVKVACVGAGCMAVKRNVLEVMATKNRFFMHEDGEPIPDLYGRDYEDGSEDSLFPVQFSEDYSFCLRARKAGFPVWIYVGGDVKHQGTKLFCGPGRLHV